MTAKRKLTDREKTRAYRERQRAKGLRQVQLWVPDTRSPEYIAEIQRQMRNIQNSCEEQEILDWCEAAAGETEGWTY
jgi:hypothetical protein